MVSLARSVASVTQAVNSADVTSMPIAVTLCSGATEFPSFVARSANVAEVIGSCYTIRASILGAATTRIEINHLGGANGISAVKFGGAGSVIGFDRTNPNPGTVGSSTGRDVTFRPSVGDVYGQLMLAFSTCLIPATTCTSNSISTRQTEPPRHETSTCRLAQRGGNQKTPPVHPEPGRSFRSMSPKGKMTLGIGGDDLRKSPMCPRAARTTPVNTVEDS